MPGESLKVGQNNCTLLPLGQIGCVHEEYKFWPKPGDVNVFLWFLSITCLGLELGLELGLSNF